MAQKRRAAKNYPREMEMKLDRIRQELRKDMQRTGDPPGQALFETADDVITGLQNAFEHYDAEFEEVWK
jgi:hypothetical protein